jgi:hypothetical protein
MTAVTRGDRELRPSFVWFTSHVCVPFDLAVFSNDHDQPVVFLNHDSFTTNVARDLRNDGIIAENGFAWRVNHSCIGWTSMAWFACDFS